MIYVIKPESIPVKRYVAVESMPLCKYTLWWPSSALELLFQLLSSSVSILARFQFLSLRGSIFSPRAFPVSLLARFYFLSSYVSSSLLVRSSFSPRAVPVSLLMRFQFLPHAGNLTPQQTLGKLASPSIMPNNIHVCIQTSKYRQHFCLLAFGPQAFRQLLQLHLFSFPSYPTHE